jgi:hypothetical protein
MACARAQESLAGPAWRTQTKQRSARFLQFSRWMLEGQAQSRAAGAAIPLGTSATSPPTLALRRDSTRRGGQPNYTGGFMSDVLKEVAGVVLIAVDDLYFHTGWLTNIGISLLIGGVPPSLVPDEEAAE